MYKEIFNPTKKIKTDMAYFADVRTLAKYNEDIVSGWLVEDLFLFLFNLDIFKQHNFQFKIDSHDSDRVIKKERNYINSDPDFVVTHKDISFKLEIQALLIPYNKFHIKKNKADRLFSMNSFIYSLLLINQEIIFFYPDDIARFGTLTKIKAFGGKDGYEYIINNLPKNKRVTNKNIDKKLLLTLYGFYFYKKLGKIEFYKFRKQILSQYSTVEDILSYFLKR